MKMNLLSKFLIYLRLIYNRLFVHPRFASFGKGSSIWSPLILGNPENIFIGKNVTIMYHCWLAASPKNNDPIKPILIIDDDCRINNFCQIYATRSIHIKRNVGIASRVYIADNQHIYEDVNISYKEQPIRQLEPIVIGEDAWIGVNVCIIGASIGKGSVIGANSVVTKNIPDYCVAVGSPAKIIKRYNNKTKSWAKTNPDGSFKIKE